MTNYKAIKFVTGQEIMANIISENDNDTITINRAVYVLPDQSDPTGKTMSLSPFIAFSDLEDEQVYNNKDIMIITQPVQALVDMMTKNFSAIIQPTTGGSNVSKLIL